MSLERPETDEVIAARPRGNGRAHRVVALVVLVLLGAIAGLGTKAPRVAAGDDDAGPGVFGVEGQEYTALGEDSVSKGVFGYARKQWEAEGQWTEGAWVFVVRRADAPDSAFRVDATVGEGGTALVSVHSVTRGVTGDATQDVPQDAETATLNDPVHVAAGQIEQASDREQGVRGLVRAAVAAGPDWAQALETKSVDAPDELDRHRLHWRAVARALEAAHEKHPRHLGIRRDLVVAYASLLPLVLGTPTASTLAMLLPDTLRAWEAAWEGYPTPDDERTHRRASAALYLLVGPAARVSDVVAADPEDPELARANAALEALGYTSIDRVDPIPVEGGLQPCHLAVWHGNGEPAEGGALFDRLTFAVEIDRGPFAGPVLDTHYTLSGRLSPDGSGAARWALYGVAAGSRRLLRLYGATEPDGQAVRDFVRQQVESALHVEKTDASKTSEKPR